MRRYAVGLAIIVGVFLTPIALFPQSRMDFHFRAELTSDSALTVTAVRAVVAFRGDVDTFSLTQVGTSLLWERTTPDTLDSVGVHSLWYLVTYSDGQVIPYPPEMVTPLATASVSLANMQQIASLVKDTLIAAGFLNSGASGPRCSVLVRDTGNATNVSGTYIRVINSAGQFYTIVQSRNDGWAIINAAAGTWYLRATMPAGYVFNAQDTMVVVGSTPTVDTIKCYQFAPGIPSVAYAKNVWGWFYSLSGTGKSGILVTAKINRTNVQRGTTILSNYAVTDTTDTAGYWQITLVSNDSLLPVGTEYRFTAMDSARLVADVTRAITKDTLLDWSK